MAQDENKAFLKRVPLFSGLTDSQIERLAAGSVRRSFPKGRTIVAEGEPSQSLYILLSGRAKVQRSDTEGKEVILAVLGPGDIVGIPNHGTLRVGDRTVELDDAFFPAL